MIEDSVIDQNNNFGYPSKGKKAEAVSFHRVLENLTLL